MKQMLTVLTLSCTLAAVSVGALGQATPGKDPKLGTRITIRGCVHEGTGHNDFVLLGMTERPAAMEATDNVITAAPMLGLGSKAPTPLPIYWLDSTQGLRERVGHIVDITGEVQEKKTKTGTITVSINPDDASSKEVALESGTKAVTSEKFRPAGATPPASTVVLTRASYFLSVEKVNSVAPPVNGVACK